MQARCRAGFSGSFLDTQTWQALIHRCRLSPRESEIVNCILARIDDQAAIASRLGVSSHTVHTYLDRLYRKVGVKTRSQLVVHIFAAYVEQERKNKKLDRPSS